MRKPIWFLILASICFGCGGSNVMVKEEHEVKMKSYIGWTCERIIDRWGKPDKTIPCSDHCKILEYRDAGSTFVGTCKIPFEAPLTSNPLKLLYRSYDCTTKFTISSDNLVKSVEQQGENCHLHLISNERY